MLKQRLVAIQKRIARQANLSQRNIDSIELLAASKAQPSFLIREAYEAGLCHFGENYLQEALEKQKTLLDLSITWHFIGPIQSNKAGAISANFDWVHSVARESVAYKLNQYRLASQTPLQICVQVNLDDEERKSGLSIKECEDFIPILSTLPQLQLRGLMAIPKPHKDYNKQVQSFTRLKQLKQRLNKLYNLKMDTLSMGMSTDLEAAIASGSTLLRIGRALFGERQ